MKTTMMDDFAAVAVAFAVVITVAVKVRIYYPLFLRKNLRKKTLQKKNP